MSVVKGPPPTRQRLPSTPTSNPTRSAWLDGGVSALWEPRVAQRKVELLKLFDENKTAIIDEVVNQGLLGRGPEDALARFGIYSPVKMAFLREYDSDFDEAIVESVDIMATALMAAMADCAMGRNKDVNVKAAVALLDKRCGIDLSDKGGGPNVAVAVSGSGLPVQIAFADPIVAVEKGLMEGPV